MSGNMMSPCLKRNRDFIWAMVILSVVSLSSILIELLIPDQSIAVVTALVLMISCMLMTLLLGAIGFIISMCYSLLGIVSFTYDYLIFSDEFKLYRAFASIATLIIVLIIRTAIRLLQNNITILEQKLEQEEASRIKTETEKITFEEVIRTGRVLKHDDLSEPKEYAHQIGEARHSLIDPLTTLPNRAASLDHLKKLLSNPGYPSVIYLSIDGSKFFDAEIGHRTIDLFTQLIGHRLRESAYEKDLVGRVASYEFVVITNYERSTEELEDYANMLRDSVSKAVYGHYEKEYSNEYIYVGYASFPAHGVFPGELINNAECAMRSAMSSNSNRVIKSPITSEARPAGVNADTIEEMGRVIDEDIETGKLHMVYQPRFDNNNQLIGFEAFLKNDDERFNGFSMLRLIKIAEKCGRIEDIGRLSISSSLTTLKLINEKNPHLSMAINISEAQLIGTDAGAQLVDQISLLGINPSNVILDIPEEAVEASDESIISTLGDLSSRGITIALDNFGRGYSYLSNIPLLPISLVKLDSNFTKDLLSRSLEARLSSSVISALKEIDVPVVATGVETETQYNELKSFGCSFYQGLYLGDMMLSSEALELAESKN